MSITVLLADDTALMRKAIRRMLECEPEIEIVGEAEDFAQTIKLTTDLRPQVVVMDLHMPDSTRFNPSELKASLASCASRLLAISIWNNEDAKTLAISYGAITLLDKPNLATELIPAIKGLL